MIRLGKLEGTLLFSFLTLFLFSLLYVCRTFDHNTLTSWQWVFREGDFARTLSPLAGAVILSLIISRLVPLEKYPVQVLTAVGTLAVLPLWSAPELMLDSARYFLQAKSLSEYGISFFFREWGRSITVWTDMPLVPFLYGLILRFGNESRLIIQLYNTTVFLFTLLLTYKTGSLIWNREQGLYAGLLLTGIPYLLTQVPQMLVDMHAMFFLALALYCFVKALGSDDLFSLLLSSSTLITALFVKYSTWPLLTLFPMAIVTLHRRGNRTAAIKRAFLILLPTTVVALVLFTIKWDVIAGQIKLLLDYQRPALRLWGEGMTSIFLFQSHPFIALLILLSLFRAYHLRDRRFLFLFSFCLLVFVLRIDRIRYTIPLLPFVTLTAAYGLAGFEERTLRRLAASLAVTSSLVIAWTVYLPFFQTTSMMNLKNAGAALDLLDQKVVEVSVQPQEKSEGSTFMAIPLLDLFTKKKIVSGQSWPQEKPAHLSVYSPLLFTWKQKKPAYYDLARIPGQPALAMVIISSTLVPDHAGPQSASDRRRPVQRFTRHADIFRYRTFISLYP